MLGHRQTLSLLDKWCELPVFQEARRTSFALCSTGMKKLLLFCRATLHDPTLLLLDEPLGNLDGNNLEFFIKRIKEFSSNGIVVFSSHQLSLAEQLATKTLNLGESLVTNNQDVAA